MNENEAYLKDVIQRYQTKSAELNNFEFHSVETYLKYEKLKNQQFNDKRALLEQIQQAQKRIADVDIAIAELSGKASAALEVLIAIANTTRGSDELSAPKQKKLKKKAGAV